MILSMKSNMQGPQVNATIPKVHTRLPEVHTTVPILEIRATMLKVPPSKEQPFIDIVIYTFLF